jgi:thermostable 8-oxoguanine DNA glycosylase
MSSNRIKILKTSKSIRRFLNENKDNITNYYNKFRKMYKDGRSSYLMAIGEELKKHNTIVDASINSLLFEHIVDEIFNS